MPRSILLAAVVAALLTGCAGQRQADPLQAEHAAAVVAADEAKDAMENAYLACNGVNVEKYNTSVPEACAAYRKLAAIYEVRRNRAANLGFKVAAQPKPVETFVETPTVNYQLRTLPADRVPYYYRHHHHDE